MARSFVKHFCLVGLSFNLLPAATPQVFVALSNGATSISRVDATTGTAQRVLPTAPGAYNLTLSPDGKQAYVLSPSDYLDGCPCGNNSVTVWNLATGALAATYALSGSPWELYFSPDGHFAYVVGSDQTVKGDNFVDTLHLFTLNTLTQTVSADQPFPALAGYVQVVQNAISPNGKRLYVPTSLNGGVTSVAVFALPSLTLLHTFSVGPVYTEITGIAVTTDSQSVLVGSVYESNYQNVNTIAAYSTQTFQLTASVMPTGTPYAIAVSPDGQYAYTSVGVTQPAEMDNIQIIALPGLQLSVGAAVDGPNALAISPDGTKLLAGSQIIDLQNESVLVNAVESLSGQVIGQFLPGSNAIWLLNQGSSQLAVIPEGGTSPSHKLATGELPSWIAFGPNENIDVLDDELSLINAADGLITATVPLKDISDQPAQFLAYGAGQVYIASSQGVESYNLKTQQFTTLALPQADPPDFNVVAYMAATRNGRNLYIAYIYTGSIPSGGIFNFDTATNQQVGLTQLSPNGAFVISADGGTIYVNTSSGTSISVVDTKTNSVVKVFPLDGYVEFASLALAPDGNTLYALDLQLNTVFLLDTASGQKSGVYSLTDTATSMALAPDGSELYISNSGTNNVTVIDTATSTQSSINVGSPSSFVAIRTSSAPDSGSGNAGFHLARDRKIPVPSK